MASWALELIFLTPPSLVSRVLHWWVDGCIYYRVLVLLAGCFFNDPAILSCWWMEISIEESVWLAAIHFPFQHWKRRRPIEKEKNKIVLDYNLFQPARFLSGILPLDRLKKRSKVQRSNRKCGGHRPWRRSFRKCCRTGRESLWKTANQLFGNWGNITNIDQYLTNSDVWITGVQQLLHFVRCLRSILRPR